MKYLIMLLMVCVCAASFAQSTVIRHHVTVLQQATPATCKAARQGSAGPEHAQDFSMYGRYKRVNRSRRAFLFWLCC